MELTFAGSKVLVDYCSDKKAGGLQIDLMLETLLRDWLAV